MAVNGGLIAGLGEICSGTATGVQADPAEVIEVEPEAPGPNVLAPPEPRRLVLAVFEAESKHE